MRTLFQNAKIYTSDQSDPYADAMLVEDGIFCWVGRLQGGYPEKSDGSPADVSSGKGQVDRTVDLGGRTVIPGLIDAHMHPLMLAEYSKQIACLPPKINSISELQEAIRREAASGKQTEGELPRWILGWGYDEGKYREGRSPDRYDLDAASPERPVYLVRSCEHIRCVNSKALEIAGIDRNTPDPPGGEIERDQEGEPTGILKENARDLVLPHLPAETDEEIVEALAELGRLLLSQGITGVSDMGNLHEGGNYAYYLAAAERGFRQRVSVYDMWDYFMADPDYDLSPARMDPRARIRMAGIKLIGDGSISGKTAWLHRPYLGTDEVGMPVYSDAEMDRAIAFAKRTGCQLAVHAMGGQAIDRAITRIAGEQKWTDGIIPHVRMEHITEPGPVALQEASRCGIAFASQPIFEYCEIETYRKNMDQERLRHLYPHRTELKAGVKLALSTDAPATSWAVPSDPFSNMKAAVTRVAYDGTDIGQGERIDIEMAIRLYTKEAAEISGMAGSGMIRAGYDADFVVLSEDIFTMEAERLDEVKVLETYILGEPVYQYGTRKSE